MTNKRIFREATAPTTNNRQDTPPPEKQAAKPVVVPANLDPRLSGKCLPPELDPILAAKDLPPEFGGVDGPEPTRFGDWEAKGRCTDF